MNVNNATISGRIGREPEIRYTQDGLGIANFSVAVQGYSKKRDKDDQPTHWLDVKAFGSLAEFIAKHAPKGARVFVSGELQQEKWQTQNGENRSRVVINARQIDLMDWKETGQYQNASPRDQGSAPRDQAAPPADSVPRETEPYNGADDGFDDIPF